MASELNYKEGEVIANKYVIESYLERSSSSQCYLCSENYSQEKMCVKLFNLAFSQELLSSPNFFLKAGATTQLEHPNVIKVFEINSEVNQVYVARQYSKGLNLIDWKTQNPDSAQSRKKAVEIIWQASQGLSAIHERGKHLQLHPHNIVLGELGAVIMDWDPRGMTDVDINCYMPALSLFGGYRAAEFAKPGTEVYPNADLYSLGAALYFLLTGLHPETGKGRESLKVSNMTPKVIDFIMRAMDPNPGKRFQDVLSFSDELWNLTEEMEKSGAGSHGAQVSEPSQQLAFESDPFSSLEAAFAEDPSPGFSQPQAPPPPTPLPKQSYTPPPKKDPPKASFTQKAFFEGQKTIVDKSSSLSSSSQNDSGGFFSSLEGTPPPSSKHSSPNKFSLEEKEYGVSQNQTQASYTMFGFKGLQGGQTMVQGEGGVKKARNWILIALATLAGTAFVILAALLIHQVISKRGNNAQQLEDSGPVQLNETSADVYEVEAGGDILETPPESDAAETEPVKEDPVDSEGALTDLDKATQEYLQSNPGGSSPTVAVNSKLKYSGNYKVSGERETQIMEMYSEGKWPATAAECLSMADDLNDLTRVQEANKFYNRVLEYSDVSTKERIHAYGALGITYKTMGQMDKSKESFQALLSVDPGNSFAQRQLANMP